MVTFLVSNNILKAQFNSKVIDVPDINKIMEQV